MCVVDPDQLPEIMRQVPIVAPADKHRSNLLPHTRVGVYRAGARRAQTTPRVRLVDPARFVGAPRPLRVKS